MTRREADERGAFVGALYNAIPDGTPYDKYAGMHAAASELMRLARRHGRIAERLCNEPDDSGKLARADERCEERIKALCSAKPLSCAVDAVILGGDPRGYTVKVRLKDGRHNTWGGAEDGWGVPQ